MSDTITQLNFLECSPAIQGGDYCLKGTCITIGGIIEALGNGRTIREMVKALKKWKYKTTKKHLEMAIEEYQMRTRMMYPNLYETFGGTITFDTIGERIRKLKKSVERLEN